MLRFENKESTFRTDSDELKGGDFFMNEREKNRLIRHLKHTIKILEKYAPCSDELCYARKYLNDVESNLYEF